jgi:hypothetical protein
MDVKQITKGVALSLLLSTILFLLANIMSHSDCGTAGIDFMPCGYMSRVAWSLQNGFWIPFLPLTLIFFGGFAFFGITERKSSDYGLHDSLQVITDQ